MQRNTQFTFIAILIGVCIIAWLLTFVPQIAAAGASTGPFLVFVAGMTQIIAVGYFVSNLRTFKRDLRIAYYLVAAGLLIFSFLQMVPTFSIFVTLDNVLLANSLYIGPYLLGGFLMYIGMRKFARLLELRDRWASLMLVVGMSLLLAGVVVLMPHPYFGPEVPESSLDIIMGPIAWCGGFSIATALLALHIRRVISPIYKSAMLWFALAMGTLAFTTYHEIITKLYLTADWYVGNISLWPFTLTGILFLIAGMVFRDAGKRFIHLPSDASPIDVVITMAQLVSKPAVIDPELDKIRSITATRSSAELSKTDKSIVLDVYLKIENYLLTKEPLHNYTREGLRADLPNTFLEEVKKRTS